MRTAVLAAVTLTLLQSCASQPKQSAVTCPPTVRPAAGWQVVVEETGKYQVRVPPSLEHVDRDKTFFVHGGDVWSDGDTKVSISFGHWAEMSFDEEPGERCHMQIEDAYVFMIVSPRSVLAWYGYGSGSHEPVVVVSRKSGDLGALAAVALSLERVW